MLLLSGWLSDLYRVPLKLVIFMGVVNLAYASYSLPLARRSIRPMGLIIFLAAANFTWALVCIGLAVFLWQTISPWGLAHLGVEAIFVGGLAILEWRWREDLRTA